MFSNAKWKSSIIQIMAHQIEIVLLCARLRNLLITLASQTQDARIIGMEQDPLK